MAVIGPFNSLLRPDRDPDPQPAPGGPLAIISPSNTHTGLTRTGHALPPDGLARRAGRLLPDRRAQLRPAWSAPTTCRAARWRRAREAAGAAGASTCSTTDDFWQDLLADPFRNAAKRLGVRIAGSATYDPAAESYAAIVDRVASARARTASCSAGDPFNGGDKVVKALRDRFGKRLTIMGSFDFAFVPDVLEIVGPAARGMYVDHG